ncbi:pentatricopeptide repeat-containing protein At3g12770 [Momordica charantia]|uniref:Pentatricopeptide repeat-containing protein At3g12770 n=1 Tax=Momordica charantia TaxID=3673 RepID=A0A6J1CD43_MOMCH|nr:pentatricopeptide repeat-containing protein At3g12770 [Momordica charantia]XP_022139118.1 pentatricopeptide repeat-containing protein At3g12770 [Momordica charantia]XP_022139119.1 pentatricopeptide repeat-containing protein At3g12770 [Momordica charantia]
MSLHSFSLSLSLSSLSTAFSKLAATSQEALLGRKHLDQLYVQLIVSGLHKCRFLVIKFVNACLHLGDVYYAHKAFREVLEPDILLWNAVIKGYTQNNIFVGAVKLYTEMQVSGVHPDCFTFLYVLKACGGMSIEEIGKQMHGQTFKYGFGSNVFVQNSLVSMYAKFGQTSPARVVFDKLQDRTVVSWTSIISGYVQNGDPAEALSVFKKMRQSNVKLDWIALVSVMTAYTDMEDLGQGKSIHGLVTKLGLEFEPDIVVSLTTMYAKRGQVEVARFFFNQMEKPNLVLWNAMISGYAKNGYGEEAIKLFREMISKNIRVDSVTVRSAILAGAQVGSLDLARWLDGYISKSEYRDDTFVNTALIDMYAKCGSIYFASLVFDRMVDKDVVLWSAMIMGYGLHGHGKEAINLYNAMKQVGVRPNDVTFVGLLTACKNSGLVKEGWDLFHEIRDHGIEPHHQHYSCVVDLLGRAGYLNQAYDFIMNMPIKPGVSVWGALLSACKIHRQVKLGEIAAEQLFSLDPYNTGHYVQLSNLYASAHLWNHVANVRLMMTQKGLNKDLGHSSIEINGNLETFHVGDRSHPRSKEIFEELDRLERRLKAAGYIPHMESVLHDLNHEEIEETLCNHSERLAVAYGIISTAPGTPLRITNNLRACVNCHSAIKLISKLVDREIIIRDAKRFHRFKDGACSCGDFW